MISYIDYDENDYTDDDFYYESKKDKIKKNKEKRSNYDETEYELRLKEKHHTDSISKLREYKNQV